MLEIVAAIFALLLIWELPGLTIIMLLKLPFQKLEVIFISGVLSVSFWVLCGILLDKIIISKVTVLVSLGSVLLLFVFILPKLARTLNDWSAKRILSNLVMSLRGHTNLVLKQICLWLLIIWLSWRVMQNWGSALGVHSIDMCWHIYWTKTLIKAGHIPDYTIVEPFDQAIKFVFFPHFALAVSSIVLQNTPEMVYSVVLLWFTMISLLGVFCITKTLTGSYFASLLSSMLYVEAYHPGAYIMRGNLPDIMGYLLVLAATFVLIRFGFSKRGASLLLLIVPSVLVVHQYATLVVSLILILTMSLWIIKNQRHLTLYLNSA
ncbi:MAG: hypothetical protein ACPL07_04155, partial [Candidatus Bathyarchaeia archaeon]